MEKPINFQLPPKVAMTSAARSAAVVRAAASVFGFANPMPQEVVRASETTRHFRQHREHDLMVAINEGGEIGPRKDREPGVFHDGRSRRAFVPID